MVRNKLFSDANNAVGLQDQGTRTSPARLSFVLKAPAKSIPHHMTGSWKGPVIKIVQVRPRGEKEISSHAPKRGSWYLLD